MASAFKVPSVPRCCRSRCLGRCPGGKCCRLRSFSALPLGRRTAAGKGCRMRREWEPEDLLACWTLMDPDRQLLVNKAGATRLGFAVSSTGFDGDHQAWRNIDGGTSTGSITAAFTARSALSRPLSSRSTTTTPHPLSTLLRGRSTSPSNPVLDSHRNRAQPPPLPPVWRRTRRLHPPAPHDHPGTDPCG